MEKESSNIVRKMKAIKIKRPLKCDVCDEESTNIFTHGAIKVSEKVRKTTKTYTRKKRICGDCLGK